MYSFKVWIDGDSCPSLLRSYIASAAKAKRITSIFVANSTIPLPHDNSFIEMVVCGNSKDAADNLIFSKVSVNDIVVTRDIVFASRLVKKGIFVINDRGTVFTKENVDDRLRERDFNLNLAQIGLGGKSKYRYGEKELIKFKNIFERKTSQLIVNETFKAR